MIYISQGHENSIGIEVFIKSFILLSPSEQAQLCFVGYLESLEKSLQSIKIKFSILPKICKVGSAQLNCIFLTKNEPSQTTNSLLEILGFIQNTDILMTLPTSKNQLILNNTICAGYTEFFRNYYHNNDLSMIFRSPQDQIVLITDHLPLEMVARSITKESIVNKIKLTLNDFKKHYFEFEEVLFAGINPHAGEGGLLGHEDQKIKKAISQLKKNFPSMRFHGPISGDVLYLAKNNHIKQLFVFMYHDQGLTLFKSRNQFIGINITLGLPFLRMSVDHGTAFELFGKNLANYQGCYYLLKDALRLTVK